MYCNEKKKILEPYFHPSYALYCSNSNTTLSLDLFLILFAVSLREVILDPVDPRLQEVKNVVLKRRNRRDHSLVSANGRCLPVD